MISMSSPGGTAVPAQAPEERSDIDAIEKLIEGLRGNWSGYADDLGPNAGRCEMFCDPTEDGYRTGSVFRVLEDCDCGCTPPAADEMLFIGMARAVIPLLLAELRATAAGDHLEAARAELGRLESQRQAVLDLCDRWASTNGDVMSITAVQATLGVGAATGTKGDPAGE